MNILVLCAALLMADELDFQACFQQVCATPRRQGEVLATLPRNADLGSALGGFASRAGAEGLILQSRTPGALRMGALDVEVPADLVARRHHYRSPDGTLWVDLLECASDAAARQIADLKGQTHSGFWGRDLASFFTYDCAPGRDAVALVARRDELVVNVGLALPFRIVPPQEGGNSVAEYRALSEAIDSVARAVRAVVRTCAHPGATLWLPPVSPGEKDLQALRVASFTRLWSEVKYNFVFLDQRPLLDWDRVLEIYLPQVMAARTDQEYVKVLMECVALLEDGHSNVYPDGIAQPPLDRPPLRLAPVEERPVITHLADVPALADTGLEPGFELLAVAGRPVEDILREDLYPYTFASTPQDRDGRAFARLLEGPPGSTVEATFLQLDGDELTVTLTRDAGEHRERMAWRQRRPVEFERLDDDLAYVALNTFNQPSVSDAFDSYFDQILTCKGLILDLRANGGGNSSVGFAVIARLIEEPCAQTSTWRTRRYQPAHRAWGREPEWTEGNHGTIQPRGARAFTGPVAVLIGPRTYSAAEDFLVPLKASGRALLVGEPTGGSTGQPLSVSLHAAQARICTKWDRFPDGTEFVGVGVQPDLLVVPSAEDVAVEFDVVLERAREALRERL